MVFYIILTEMARAYKKSFIGSPRNVTSFHCFMILGIFQTSFSRIRSRRKLKEADKKNKKCKSIKKTREFMLLPSTNLPQLTFLVFKARN